MKLVAVLISLPLWWTTAAAQVNPEEEIDLQRLSDDLVGYQDEDADYEDLYENLVQVLSSPYDLNTVTDEELSLLHILTDMQVENFIAYRRDQGKILDVYELQVIPGFDLVLISRLLPFVKVKDPSASANGSFLQRLFSPGNSYFISRYERTLETKNGFKSSPGNPSPFRGSPDKLYVRLRSSQPGNYSIGMTGEKDAGEKLGFQPGKGMWGFDFVSWHLQLQHKGKLKNLVVGDFQAQFAQGLLLGGGFGLGKGGETVSTARKSHVGFLPYTSVNESACQRGIAFTVQPFGCLSVSAFYSNARRDASAGGIADSLTVNSFQVSGLHRTEGELENRKKAREQNMGVVLHLDKNKLDGGVMINVIHFDTPVKRTPTLYNQFAFSGSSNLNTGIFLNYRFRNISFFSEAGHSFSGGSGAVLGLLMSPHQHLDVALVYRHYGRDFHTFYSNAFSEGTQPANERGVYWGWKYRWNRHYNITGYADLFTFPWPGFRRYAPSGGYEWLLRGNCDPSRRVSLFLQVREELKSRNVSEMTNLYQLEEGLRRNVTASCDYGVGASLRLRSRWQYSSYSFNKHTTEGFALVQDISFKWGRLKFSGRHALFDTDHYDNRLYVHEGDAWLAYSLPSYSGVGVRNYALIEYKVHKQLTIWFRFARTRLTGAGEIGSGQDIIEGNTRNDVKFQARFKF